ncbi:MAG: phenylacetate--CoA ligase [Rhodospirillaceae bacterium]|nr:phenylacetate--CoA ligase [Rhodospirillaceae bacterium]MBL6931080.1 phenylacetate--CoA ligase [Rhodospirillales bacterium]
MNAKAALDPIETASRDEISALQLERLKWSVKHAYDNVDHYKNSFDEAGVHPDDIQSLSDLPKFPLSRKKHIRDNYPFGMFAVPKEQVIRVHASSGTTGNPTVVGYTRKDIDTWSDLVARSLRAAGAHSGQIAHIAFGYGLRTNAFGLHYGAEKLGCMVIPMSGGQAEKQLQLINDFKPDIVMVTPSYMLSLGDMLKRNGIDPRDTSIKIGIHGAEPWTYAMRDEIEQLFGIDALDIYGLSEVMGPGVACECVEDKDGLHIWEDHFYPEIIDPETEEVLPDGEQGELVLTSLTKEALPVIRFRTRDLTRLMPGTARSMRRMERVGGRSDDMLIIRGRNVFPSQIEEVILQDKRLSPHYSLEVTRHDRMENLTVLAEVRPDAGGFGETFRQEISADLARRIKLSVGFSVNTKVLPVDEIERSMGRVKRIIDLREAD